MTVWVVSSSMEEDEGEGLAFRLPFPLNRRTDIKSRKGGSGKKGMEEMMFDEDLREFAGYIPFVKY